MHIFIDYLKLPEQSLSESFGVNPSDSNKFIISTGYKLIQQSKAFACQDGLMIVQQSDIHPDLVNLIIKPIKGLEISLGNVQYYVYRGIQKDSLIVDSKIISKNNAKKHSLIERIWENAESYWKQAKIPLDSDLSEGIIGYDSSLQNDVKIESIYNYFNENVSPILVKEGEWIADFSSIDKIKFEIILDVDKLNNPSFDNEINLGYLRKGEHEIDVTNLTGFTKRAKQELILSYIDPCAFFGMHYDLGVNTTIINENNSLVEVKKQGKLYSDLLIKFLTKNRVYIDIRSEKGYSYNFYQNYNDGFGNNIKIGNSETVASEKVYGYNGWPILVINTTLETTLNKNNVKINLRIDDNTKPILYIQNIDLLIGGNKTCLIDEKKLLNNGGWSKDLDFVFPNTGSNLSKDNVANYLKLQYFRQEYNISAPNMVLINRTYFDLAFCPINLTNLYNSFNIFQQVQNPSLNYVSGQLTDNSNSFGYVSDSGAFWDNERILFYSQMVFQNKISGQFYTKYKGIENKLSIGGKYFKLSFLQNDVNINCKVLQEENGENNYKSFNSISLSHYNGFSLAKENLLLLGIKKNELQLLIEAADSIDQNTNLSNLSAKHHRYLFLEEELSSPKIDKNGIIFRKFKLKVQGITPSGICSIIEPKNDIFIYTTDGLCFTSIEFSEREIVNDINNLIEFLPLDTDNFYNSVRRLSMFTIDTLDWQLYNLDGLPKKYDAGELNYSGDLIAELDIKLPVGTRSIILGRSKKLINSFYCYYIVCFHQGHYREGFVDISAFKNSNKGENNTLERVNYLEGKNHPQVLWRSFLDDSNHILKYLEAYVQVESINLLNQPVSFYQPFINLLAGTREAFNIVSQFTPSILNERLGNLFNILRSLDLNMSNTGNLKVNPNNIPDSIERWLSLKPFDVLIRSLPSLNVILTLRFTSKWINTWNDISKDKKFYDFYNEPVNKFDLDTLVNYFEQGSSGLTIGETSSESISTTKSALRKIKYHLISRDVSDLINQTPEAIWLKSLSDSFIDATTVFVLLNTSAWNMNIQNNFFAEFAALDNSIGYLDNDYLCSLLIHEFNDSSGIKIDSGKSILLENTHILIEETSSLFDLLITKLVQGNASDFFKDNFNQFQFYQRNRQYHKLFLQTPFISVVYLNYYLNKISQ